MGQIISVVNFKGGVAKSTTVFNLAAALWTCGKKVLIVDADPQFELTTRMGFEHSDVTLNEWLLAEGLTDDVQAPIFSRYGDSDAFSFIPSCSAISDLELSFSKQADRFSSPYFSLKNCLNTIKDKFDYIFVDCPPSPGFMNKLALIASDKVIIPVECAGESLDGIVKLENTMESIRKKANPELETLGYLFTKYEKDSKISKFLKEEMKDEKVFKTVIRSSKRFKEASLYYMNIFEFYPASIGAEDYMSAAEEIFGVKRPGNWQMKSKYYFEKYIAKQLEASDN